MDPSYDWFSQMIVLANEMIKLAQKYFSSAKKLNNSFLGKPDEIQS